MEGCKVARWCKHGSMCTPTGRRSARPSNTSCLPLTGGVQRLAVVGDAPDAQQVAALVDVLANMGRRQGAGLGDRLLVPCCEPVGGTSQQTDEKRQMGAVQIMQCSREGEQCLPLTS